MSENTKEFDKKTATFGLVMIVKNEAKIIKRCLDSIADYLDYWVIRDTGSTDGTQDIIQTYFKEKEIPGELGEDEWVNFGHNRTIAVQTAKGKADFLMLMDADFTLMVHDPDFKKKLWKLQDYGAFHIRYDGYLDYSQTLLVRGDLNWKYIGVTHEYITSNDHYQIKNDFHQLTMIHLVDGNNRNNKYERDIEMLRNGLKIEPNNSRYLFYLAQSLYDKGEYNSALDYYKKRVDAKGWSEEVYYAMYKIGMCKKNKGDDFKTWIGDMLLAYNYRNHRLEALWEVVNYCRLNQLHFIGYHLGKMAFTLEWKLVKKNDDVLFCNRDIYSYRMLDELALCAYYAGFYMKSVEIGQRIINDGKYPEAQSDRLRNNITFGVTKLKELNILM